MTSMSLISGDGCTGFPDRTWRLCCDLHDAAYSAGGDKWAADWDLFWCVAPKDPIAATLMLLGVTIFGWLWWWRARRNR